jgi:hypothetical protein
MVRRFRDPRRAAVVGAVAVSLVALAVVALKAAAPKSRTSRAVEHVAEILRVPRRVAPLKLDAQALDWRVAHAQTGTFRSVDGQSTPYSEARLGWGDGKLYLLLYAADQDIRAGAQTHDAPIGQDDAFRITFTRPGEALSHVIFVSPTGTVTDESVAGDRVDTSWESGVEVAHENDGTLDNPRDEDEEWVIEMALPLSAIGLRGEPGERIGLSLRRCDVPKGAGRRCGEWGEPDGMIVLE